MNVVSKILCSEFLLTAAGFSQIFVRPTLTVSPTAITYMSNTDQSFVSSSCGSSAICNLNVGSTQGPLFFNSTASSDGDWLKIIPLSNPVQSTPGLVRVVLSFPSGKMNVGTYSGMIKLTGYHSVGTTTSIVPVRLTVVNPGLVASPANLAFSVPVGATSIITQGLTVSSTTSPIETSFGVTILTGAPWLYVRPSTPSMGFTSPVTMFVTVDPAGLPAGTYNGSIGLLPKNNSALIVPVTLAIGVQALTASPPQLTFAYQIGGPIPNSQTLQVSGGTSGLTFNVQSSTISGGNWLLVNPITGTAPAPISVSVNPLNLPVGSYQGAITVSGTNGASGSTVVPVGLTVAGQLPTITSLVNAASFLNQAVSPGEAVSIFGTTIGPPVALELQLDSTGKVATSLGNVEVLFSGHLAPLTYVSATQINCMAPYEIGAISNPSVQVRYSGQTSNSVQLTSALTSPAIFATNGTGQGAILNQDGSVNGPANPEAVGNIVTIFMTGEGQTSPSGVTGSVTCRTGCNTLQQIPVPLQSVTAVVGNQPADVTFYGEAPSLVAGVLQVNLRIPPNTPSGSIPLAISVGGTQSQPGVTLSVR